MLRAQTAGRPGDALSGRCPSRTGDLGPVTRLTRDLGMIVWRDGVVPVAMELGTFDVAGGHVCIRYDNASGILAGVEFAAHGEAGFGCGGRDQFDDDPVANERLG